ncbi:hypothetical protein AGDE_14923 [Angomonas deanei]|nr:hypothetical protein AGDE_14923 [Angomonas deanei]|eukprot:EPY19989.1 hypothetical protein AGDE_14923 [Angomonas deanei]
MTQVHVFDFDGTLFYSPTPDPHVVGEVHGSLKVSYDKASGGGKASPTVNECFSSSNTLFNRLNCAKCDGGLGWFQSLSSLSPPHVPAQPSEKEWYVPSVLERLRRLGSEKERSPDKIFLYVLTGRDVKYTARIEELLKHVGVFPSLDGVILKPTETFGTVKYKLNTFVKLAATHAASHMYYYEDRPRQGARLLAGMQAFVSSYFPSSAGVVEAYWLTEDEHTPLPYSGDRSPCQRATLLELVDQNGKEEASAVNYGTRWVSTFQYTTSSSEGDFDDIGIAYVNDPTIIRFVKSSSFHFIMLLVPPEHEARCTSILDKGALSSLLVSLLRERDVYDATGQQGRGGGGGGYHRGRGRGHGAKRGRGRGYHHSYQ